MPERTPLEDFHNRLRILHSIDLHELREAGLDLSGGEWMMFSLKPADWFIRASDEHAAIIWSILERRSNRAATIREGIG